jgi:putative phage-type endonuclease
MTNAISTIEMPKEVWQEQRQKGIGGSDVAAILGLSKYRTPLDIYNQKVKGEKTELSKPMFAGLMLEDTIAKWYMIETGKKVLNDNKIRIHKDYSFLLANLDRIILPENGEGRGVLEIKTAGAFASKNWESEPPIEYTLQIQHYFDVTGFNWGEFAVLVGGNDFRRYYIQRDQELIDLKNEKLLAFWNNHILTQTPPDPVNSEDVEKLYSKHSEGKIIEAVSETVKTIESIKEIRKQIKELEASEELLSERIKIMMQDAEAIFYKGEVLTTWKAAKDSNSFDSKTFKEKHPDLYNEFLVTKPGSRRFLIK